MIKTYITQGAMEVLHDIASRRSHEELKAESDRIYKALKKDLNEVMNGRENICITRVVDRKIGKTYSLVRLACEYNLPIVPHRDLKRLYEEEAHNKFGKIIKVIPISRGRSAKENCDIVLKDEGVSVQEVIDYFWPRKVKIVGVSSMFED